MQLINSYHIVIAVKPRKVNNVEIVSLNDSAIELKWNKPDRLFISIVYEVVLFTSSSSRSETVCMAD